MLDLTKIVNDNIEKAKPGDPAIDALDAPRWNDGRHMKCAYLVCEKCGEYRLFLNSPDTTVRFGDSFKSEDCGCE